MGTSAESQRLARMAKIRLYSHEDGGPEWSVHWHWQGWDDSDGTVIDQNGGSYTGSTDEVYRRLVDLMFEMRTHMIRGIEPFPTPQAVELEGLTQDAARAMVEARMNGHLQH